MNLKDILELIDKVADRGIGALEVEQAGTKLRIEGKALQPQVIHSYVGNDLTAQQQSPPSIPLTALPAPQSSAAQADAGAKKSQENDPSLHIITSPIVGTFYRSPNPESPVFVNVGDRITKGQVLCIIEAMKLMNEIEADVAGTVIAILAEDGASVEYGQPLFKIA